jgi:hypothetical protein
MARPYFPDLRARGLLWSRNGPGTSRYAVCERTAERGLRLIAGRLSSASGKRALKEAFLIGERDRLGAARLRGQRRKISGSDRSLPRRLKSQLGDRRARAFALVGVLDPDALRRVYAKHVAMFQRRYLRQELERSASEPLRNDCGRQNSRFKFNLAPDKACQAGCRSAYGNRSAFDLSLEKTQTDPQSIGQSASDILAAAPNMFASWIASLGSQ